MNEHTHYANTQYDKTIKRLKYDFNEEYPCSGIIKDYFGKDVKVDNFCFKLLNDDFDLSPMLVISFYDKGEVYFADSNFILDKYDKNGIIKTLEEKRFYNTYDISLLKTFLKEIEKEK